MADDIEVGVDVKINGLTKIKQELKELRGELVNATDPAEIERLSMATGQLSDKINDANERIKVFAAGSNFEVVSNGLGLIGSQLSNMDFEGAKESAQMLTATIKKMNPQEVIAGFKAFMSTIGQLSKAFVQMGFKLLANPLFFLVAVIAAIVIAIVMLKDKLAIAQKGFDMLMNPIKAVIQWLKNLSDALGLSAFAAEDSAARQIAANNKAAASSKTATDLKVAQMDREINQQKALGKNTDKLEKERLDAQIKGADKQISLATSTNIALQNKIKARGTDKTKEEKVQLQESYDTIQAEKQAKLNFESEKVVIDNSAYKKAIDKQRDANDKLSEAQRVKNEKEKQEKEKNKQDLINLEQKYIDDINGLLATTEEEKLALAKEREQREIDALKAKGLNVTAVQAELDGKYTILREQMEQEKFDKLKEITLANELEMAKLKDGSRNAELNRQKEAELSAIDKITKDETKKAEAKKAVEDKYKLLKRDADAAKFEEDNSKALEDAESELLSYEERLAIVAKREALTTANLSLNLDERKRIEKENSDARQAIEDAKFEAGQKMQQAVAQGLGVAAEALGQSTAAGKAAAVAAATISTYTAIAGQLQAFSSIPVPGYAIAQAIATGAMGLMQVKNILSVKTPKGGGGGAAPSIGGAGGGGAAPTAPSFALFGKNNDANTAREGQSVQAPQSQNIQVTAIVSETEITSTQGRVARMNASGEL